MSDNPLEWYDEDSNSEEEEEEAMEMKRRSRSRSRSSSFLYSDIQKEQSSQRLTLSTWNTRVRQWLANLFVPFSKILVNFPLSFMIIGFLVCLFFGIGVIFRGEPEEDITQLWLKRDGYEIANKKRYEKAWGKYTLEQVIVTTKQPGGNLLDQNKLAILEAFDLYQRIVNIPSNLKYNDLCYQPAKPVSQNCLQFTPFDYWNYDRDKILQDPNLGKTVTPNTVDGLVDGVIILREQVNLFLLFFLFIFLFFFLSSFPSFIRSFIHSFFAFYRYILRMSLNSFSPPWIVTIAKRAARKFG